MSSSDVMPSQWQTGAVVRLNTAAGFGYVRKQPGQGTFIFVVVRALRHSEALRLGVGTAVRFRKSTDGCID